MAEMSHAHRCHIRLVRILITRKCYCHVKRFAEGACPRLVEMFMSFWERKFN